MFGQVAGRFGFQNFIPFCLEQIFPRRKLRKPERAKARLQVFLEKTIVFPRFEVAQEPLLKVPALADIDQLTFDHKLIEASLAGCPEPDLGSGIRIARRPLHAANFLQTDYRCRWQNEL